MLIWWAALDADERSDPALPVDPAHIRRRVRHLEVGGIARGDALHQVDLLKGDLDGFVTLDLHGDPDRPELAAHQPLAQAGNIGHQRPGIRRVRQSGGIRAQINGRERPLEAVANLPRQVIVTVDERSRLEYARDARLVIGIRTKSGRRESHRYR